MVRATLFWKDGTEMKKSTESRSLMKVGQKSKSDSTTYLPWKTIPMKLQLKKGDGGKRTGMLFQIKKEHKVRQDNDRIFREAKHAYRQLYKEHAESTGEGNNSIQSSTPNKTKLSTTI